MGGLTPSAMRVRRGVVADVDGLGGFAALVVVVFGMPDPSTVVCEAGVRVGTSVPGTHVEQPRKASNAADAASEKVEPADPGTLFVYAVASVNMMTVSEQPPGMAI